jgi:hypothetical protein
MSKASKVSLINIGPDTSPDTLGAKNPTSEHFRLHHITPYPQTPRLTSRSRVLDPLPLGLGEATVETRRSGLTADATLRQQSPTTACAA